MSNLIQFRGKRAPRQRGCPITVFPKTEGTGSVGGGPHPKCGQPLAPGARFCAKHEADRIRLS